MASSRQKKAIKSASKTTGRKTSQKYGYCTSEPRSAMKPSKQKICVWQNIWEKTNSGLTKDMLVENSQGKIVSKRRREAALKLLANNPHIREQFLKHRKSKKSTNT